MMKMNMMMRTMMIMIPTGVVQDAMLDHTGSDFRCQNEVLTTKNC